MPDIMAAPAIFRPDCCVLREGFTVPHLRSESLNAVNKEGVHGSEHNRFSAKDAFAQPASAYVHTVITDRSRTGQPYASAAPGRPARTPRRRESSDHASADGASPSTIVWSVNRFSACAMCCHELSYVVTARSNSA